MRWRWFAMALGAVGATPAFAIFHSAEIHEIMRGVGADASLQYVEVRMLAAGQTFTNGVKLVAFNCDGTNATVLTTFSGNLANGGADRRWIVATASPLGGITRDFGFPSSPGLPSCGMVCFGIPGTVDAPDDYADCLAYGGYTGPLPQSAGPASSLAPGDGARSLTRTAGGKDYAANFALACPTPTNNAGQNGDLQTAGCLSTTSTTTTTSSTTSTSTTTLPPPLTGGPPAKTDCYGAWSVLGAEGATSVVRCVDGDARCDHGAGAGCTFSVALCFADADPAVYGGKCSVAPVSRFLLAGPRRDGIDTANFTTVLAAVSGLGGQSSGNAVSFASPLATSRCTAPFALEVPLKTRGPKTRPGRRTLIGATTAGKTDRDALKLFCIP